MGDRVQQEIRGVPLLSLRAPWLRALFSPQHFDIAGATWRHAIISLTKRDRPRESRSTEADPVNRLQREHVVAGVEETVPARAADSDRRLRVEDELDSRGGAAPGHTDRRMR